MRPASSRPAPSVRPTSRAHFGSAASSAAGRSAGGRASGARPAPRTVTTSVRLGDLPASRGDRRAPAARAIARPKRSGAFKAFIVALVLVCVLGITYAALYFSGAFAITSVKVNGADHLTNDEMAILAAVPQGTTLLNVDTSSVANSVDRDAWVADVSVNRIFPDTLEINVTEREIEPHYLVLKQGLTYLYAWCRLRGGFRLFKMGRIEFATLLYDSYERRETPDFETATEFRRQAGNIEIELAVDRSARSDVEEWLGIENVTERRDGEIRATAILPDDKSLVANLLSYGTSIRVLTPYSLVRRIRGALGELGALYA